MSHIFALICKLAPWKSRAGNAHSNSEGGKITLVVWSPTLHNFLVKNQLHLLIHFFHFQNKQAQTSKYRRSAFRIKVSSFEIGVADEPKLSLKSSAMAAINKCWLPLARWRLASRRCPATTLARIPIGSGQRLRLALLSSCGLSLLSSIFSLPWL